MFNQLEGTLKKIEVNVIEGQPTICKYEIYYYLCYISLLNQFEYKTSLITLLW